MAGIKNIRDLYKKVGEKGLREVLSGEIRVTEKFDAYRFAFEKNPHDYKIYYYGKNGKAPLSKIDRTVSDLYEQAIACIENLPAEVKRAIPVRHRFGFSWFPSQSPLNTTYNRRPKKGLVLTDITVRNRDRDVTRDVKEGQVFERWAGLFGTEASRPVYEGQLDADTVEKLVQAAQREENQFVSLNESQVHTPGLLGGGNGGAIESLVFESADQLFKVDSRVAEERKAEKRSHLFDILLLDICEHLGSINIASFKPVSIHSDEAYIEVVSEVFNDFVDKRGRDFLSSGLERPRFLDKSGRFNRTWIKNPKTVMLVESDPRYEYLFTVFLANLRKPKYPSGLLSEGVVNSFNSRIEDIARLINDDFSFLEFNSILRESDEKVLIPRGPEQPRQPDIEKSLLLLHAFFDRERKAPTKEMVQVILAPLVFLTNQLVNEAEAIVRLTGKRILLIHDPSQDPYRIPAEDANAMLSRLCDSRSDLFLGHHVLAAPTLQHLVRQCGSFYPEAVHCLNSHMPMLELETQSMAAAHGTAYLPIQPQRLSSKLFNACLQALHNDNIAEFKKCTPECVHGYWTALKSAYDRQHFR